MKIQRLISCGLMAAALAMPSMTLAHNWYKPHRHDGEIIEEIREEIREERREDRREDRRDCREKRIDEAYDHGVADVVEDIIDRAGDDCRFD